ncbi:hypothetical protein CYMTET_3693 [Cymbomonas tetramitiformis]|uniref:Uncharacterized protein n=1 Tax=Cymbomonas tetramitiformis TaxID=36881 RepID=A0AAE0H2W1_9CHLO|nr:hypothetical protein CYMTET_3693 [Cymbomonas tetramitiformis]|eukprot:gene991-1510_t
MTITRGKLVAERMRLCQTCYSDVVYTREQVEEKRDIIEGEIYKEFPDLIHYQNSQSPKSFESPKMLCGVFTEDVLTYMLKRYDQHFFKSELLQKLRGFFDVEIKFKWNNMYTNALATMQPNAFKDPTCILVEFSCKGLHEALTGALGKTVNENIAGCRTYLRCIMTLLEHELVHIIVDLFCPELSNTDVGIWKGNVDNRTHHGRVFMSILSNLFQQNDFRSYLASKKYTVLVGETVKLVDAKNEELFGTVKALDYDKQTVDVQTHGTDDIMTWKLSKVAIVNDEQVRYEKAV